MNLVTRPRDGNVEIDAVCSILRISEKLRDLRVANLWSRRGRQANASRDRWLHASAPRHEWFSML